MRQEALLMVDRLRAHVQSSSKPVAMDRLFNDVALRIIARCAFAFEDGNDPRLEKILAYIC